MVKSRSEKRNAKNARGLGRDGAAEPVRIFLMAFFDDEMLARET